MKKNKWVALSLILLSASAFAKHHKHWHTDGVAGVGDPCQILVCMTGKLQGQADPSCQAANNQYFAIKVFTPYYNSEATAQTRKTAALMPCSGAQLNMDKVEAITQQFGRLPQG